MGLFNRNILDKPTLISRLESMQLRRETHGETFTFDAYLGLTFASNLLVNELAPMVRANDQAAFAQRMSVFQERFRNAPGIIRKSLIYHLGRRRGRLESFDDLPELLSRLRGSKNS